MKTLIRYRREFDAAHQLPHHTGKCKRLHGHRWTCELGIVGEPRTGDQRQAGMVVDFGDLKAVLDDVLPDHLSMNDHVSAAADDLTVPDKASRWEHSIANPTCELIARKVYELLLPYFGGSLGELAYVRIWETPSGDATYPAPSF